MPIARSTLAGATTGVVLLAAAVGFGVGLPKVVDEPAAAAGSLPTLPDKLDDRFVALSNVTAEQVGMDTPEGAPQFKTAIAKIKASEKEASAYFTKEYGAARVRGYIAIPPPGSQTGSAQMAVTIAPGAPGLLNPQGPFMTDEVGAHYQLKDVQGKRCSVTWRDATDPATGMPTGQAPTAESYVVQCRTESKGLTYDIFSNGLTPDEVAGYLDKVIDLTDS
ncbi:hypothetical protein [Nocardioides sp. LML1-1-1.1]|uniref:hypothetical protein n=1 Tax=Nocardioides sp. LML1-1-1.1 TaxID=3135248 RepID=UPI00341F563B